MRLGNLKLIERWLEKKYAAANPLDYNEKAILAECLAAVKNTPTIEAESVRHGQWKDGKCTECGEDAPYTDIEEAVYDYDWEENLRFSHTETHREYNETPYCPNCGAKMDGDKYESN